MRPQLQGNGRVRRSQAGAAAVGCILLIATVSSFLHAGAAAAAITVTRADYGGGVLVVKGRTSRANEPVRLDNHYVERTNRAGMFTFRIRYLPRNCTVQLRAGREARSVAIDDCQPPKRTLRGGPSDGAAVSAPVAGRAGLRVVRRTCDVNRACRVACRPGEYAVNAYCLVGRARLVNEQSVACSHQAPNRIVAYCVSAADDS